MLEGDQLTVQRGHRTYHMQMSAYPQVAPYVDAIRDTLAGNEQALEKVFTVSLTGGQQDWKLQLVPLRPGCRAQGETGDHQRSAGRDPVSRDPAGGWGPLGDDTGTAAMSGRRTGALLVWAALAMIALWVVARARYSADLSAFLPQAPTGAQRLLVEQLRQGVTSRLIIVALEGADEKERSRLSAAMAARLRTDPELLAVENGDAAAASRDEAFLLCATVSAQQHSDAGAIQRRRTEVGHRQHDRPARLAGGDAGQVMGAGAIRRAR